MFSSERDQCLLVHNPLLGAAVVSDDTQNVDETSRTSELTIRRAQPLLFPLHFATNKVCVI